MAAKRLGQIQRIQEFFQCHCAAPRSRADPRLAKHFRFRPIPAARFDEKMKIKQRLAKLILLLLCTSATAVQVETAAQHDPRLAWWRTARLGMFIHWGPVSLTGQEISWSRANSTTNCP